VNARRFQLETWILVAILIAWLGALYYLSSQRWLLDIAAEPRIDLLAGETATLPGRHRGASVLRLTAFEPAPGRRNLLVLEASAGPGFTLQLIDRDRQRPVATSRFPSRFESTRYAIPIPVDPAIRRLRLDLRGRADRDLVIDAVKLAALPRSYLWLSWSIRLLGPILVVLFLRRYRESFGRYLAAPQHDSRTLASWDSLIAFVLFACCFIAYRAAPVQQLIDSKFTTAVSHYLITDASFALPSEFAPTARRQETYILQSVGDRTFHFFSDAPSVLNIPFVAAFEHLGIASVTPDGIFIRENERRILVFIAAFLAALLCSLLFLTARLWLPPPWALGLTVVFAFGTQIFSVLSRAYWSHSWAVLLLALAILLLAAPSLGDRPWTYVASSSLLCWAYFCRPPLSLSIMALTLFILVKRRRFLPWFLLTGVVWASLFVIYSLVNFDSPLPPYFLTSHLRSGRLAGGILLTSYPWAMLGTLFSPGRGMFVYVPIYLLILLVVVRRWRWIPQKSLAVVALGVCIAHWQLVSLFRNWWGGQCFGPRLMSDILPWLFLLGTLALAALRAAQLEGKFSWRAMNSFFLALTIAISIFINARGAVARETANGAGIWNWRYPQFLAGLIARPDRPADP